MVDSYKMPTYDKMLWPALQALKDMDGSSSNQEMLPKVIQIMGLPEEIQNVPHGTGTRTEVEYRLFWARTYLKKVGAIESSERGVWSITPSGRSLTESDCKQIPTRVRVMSRKGVPNSGQDIKIPEDANDDESWQDQLISALQVMPPDAFERLAQRILRESGFIKVEVKGKSGDGGIDGIGVLRVNLLSFQVFFQCKRYKDSVSAGAVRDFRGAMVGRTDKGLLITTGHFTPDAKKEATRDGAPLIDLIDGEQLCDILKALKLGVTSEMVEQVTIDPDALKGI